MEDIFEIFLEFVVEFLIRGPGRLIVSLFRTGKETDPDGCLVLFVGIAFWCAIFAVLWALFP